MALGFFGRLIQVIYSNFHFQVQILPIEKQRLGIVSSF